MTGAKKDQKIRVLDQISFICYQVQFRKDKVKDVLTVLNFGSKINAITLIYIDQLGLKMQKIDINAQKIDR